MDEYNEEELLYLIRCGSEEAIELLLEKYFYRISSWIMPYCHYEYLGFDKDDLIQIGMIHFKTILDTYRLDLNNNLYSYAKKSVIRKIVKTIEYIKEDVLYRNNFFISFDDYAYDREEGYYYKDIIPDEKETYRPENRFMIKERAIGYKKTFQSQTSSQEKEIMTYLRKGYNAKEIAKIMDISLKSVYNAIYRCRRKCKPLTKKNKCVKL